MSLTHCLRNRGQLKSRALHSGSPKIAGLPTAFETFDQRREELPRWLHRYNWHRARASFGQMPPISRLGLTRNNLVRNHS